MKLLELPHIFESCKEHFSTKKARHTQSKTSLKRVCVLGASRGLGSEIARTLVGFEKYGLEHLLLVARNQAQLEMLKDSLLEISKQVNADANLKKIQILSCDLNSMEGQLEFERALRTQEIECVLNCAGVGYIQGFLDSKIEDSTQQIDLNISTLTRISHIVGTHFKQIAGASSASQNLCLLHVSSIAAFSPLPNMAVYAASKVYGFYLCLALDKEFESFGGRCVVACPGPLNTTLFDWSKTGTLSSSQVQSPSACAKEILDGLRSGKRIIVTGASNKAFFTLSEILPSQWKKTIAHFYLSHGVKEK
jgi:uncharacterized protein